MLSLNEGVIYSWKRVKETMKHLMSKRILALGICFLMIIPQSAFAGNGTQWGSTPTQAYSRVVSVSPQSEGSQSTQDVQTKPSNVKGNLPPTLGSDSPLSLPENKSDEIPEMLTEEEAVQVLNLLSETLDTLKSDSKLSNRQILSLENASSMIKNFTQGKSSGDGMTFPPKTGPVES